MCGSGGSGAEIPASGRRLHPIRLNADRLRLHRPAASTPEPGLIVSLARRTESIDHPSSSAGKPPTKAKGSSQGQPSRPVRTEIRCRFRRSHPSGANHITPPRPCRHRRPMPLQQPVQKTSGPARPPGIGLVALRASRSWRMSTAETREPRSPLSFCSLPRSNPRPFRPAAELVQAATRIP